MQTKPAPELGLELLLVLLPIIQEYELEHESTGCSLNKGLTKIVRDMHDDVRTSGVHWHHCDWKMLICIRLTRLTRRRSVFSR